MKLDYSSFLCLCLFVSLESLSRTSVRIFIRECPSIPCSRRYLFAPQGFICLIVLSKSDMRGEKKEASMPFIFAVGDAAA